MIEWSIKLRYGTDCILSHDVLLGGTCFLMTSLTGIQEFGFMGDSGDAVESATDSWNGA